MSEQAQVARRAGLTAVGTLASRILGMARESVIAASFPVAHTDAFFIAFTIPNTLRTVLGEGAVANAFMPVFASSRERGGLAEARAFLGRFAAALALLLALTCALGILGARPLSYAYAGGFADDPAQFALVVSLTRWLFPFLFLAGLSALATGALNAMGRFGLPAFAPALTNLGMIALPLLGAGAFADAGLPPIGSLAAGALLGGTLTLLVQLPALGRLQMLSAPRLELSHPDVQRALKLMVPLTLSLGIYQINLLFSRLFASFLEPGAQSYLSYGQRVIEIPQGMFALALASATLPALARLRAEQKQEELLALFRHSLRLTLFIALPASLLLIVLAEPTVATLFGRGVFRAAQVHETSRSLALQAGGIWAVAAVRTVIPMFAAHEDPRTPVKASAVTLLVFLGLSWLTLDRLGHLGIALANSSAAALQVGLLLLLLRRKLGRLGLKEVALSAARSSLAAAAAAGVAWWLSHAQSWSTLPEARRLATYGATLLAAGLTFLLVALALRSPELESLSHAVRGRLARATKQAP